MGEGDMSQPTEPVHVEHPDRPARRTLEEKLEALEYVERLERGISAIFEAKGLGPVKVTHIDWMEDDETTPTR
jgi:hypothetical protein